MSQVEAHTQVNAVRTCRLSRNGGCDTWQSSFSPSFCLKAVKIETWTSSPGTGWPGTFYRGHVVSFLGHLIRRWASITSGKGPCGDQDWWCHSQEQTRLAGLVQNSKSTPICMIQSPSTEAKGLLRTIRTRCCILVLMCPLYVLWIILRCNVKRTEHGGVGGGRWCQQWGQIHNTRHESDLRSSHIPGGPADRVWFKTR